MRKKLLITIALLVSGVGNLWAQTDVTSTYIENADFEGEYSVFSNPRNDGNNARAIYQPSGWTVTYTDGEQNDMRCLNSSCLQWTNFSGQKQPTNGGNNTYWSRLRYGNNTKLILSQTASVPAGTYSLSVDAYKNSSNGVATISAAGKSVTIDGRSEWSNYTIVFTLTETTSVIFSYSFEGKATDTRIGVDNFKLVDITQGASDITAQNWTSMITNAGFERGTSGEYGSGQNHVFIPCGFTMNCTMDGWRDGSINTTNPSEGSNLYNLWAGTTTSLDMYQAIQLPAGKYTITADLRTEEGKITNQGVYAKIGDDTFKSATIQTTSNPFNGAGTWNTLSQDFYVQSDGSVQVGASSTGSANSVGWFQIDNFTLNYKGAIQNTVSSITPEVATDVTNDKWYAVDISADGDYRIISSEANTVTYTQDGYKIPSDISTSVDLTAGVKQVVALTRGTLYVKASTDAELKIEPDAYAYSVGDATTSVADNGYTQSNTMTVTFADATTNDPLGALSILDASKIKVDGSVATASIEGNVLTVTLASPIVASTDYAVSIEAGAVGYKEEYANAAISLTAKTPAVFDGTYFIATTDGTQFISRGGDSNTEAVLDEFGIAAEFTTDASNVTHIQFVDNDKNLFGGSSSVYTDKNESDLGENAARARWIVASVSGGYTLYCGTWSKYIKAGTGAESKKPAATYDDAAYTWVLETPATHQTKMAAYKDANAEAVATAAGLSLTTVADLETELGSNWTSSSVTPSNAYSNVTEKYQPNGYSETIISEQNLKDLKNGIYKVTLSIFHRIRDNAGTYACHQNNTDNPTSYIYANGQKMQLPSSFSEANDVAYSAQDIEHGGKHYPDGTTSAGEAFTAGKYKVEVYAVVTDGTLKIGVKDPGKYSNYNWICWRDLSVTSYVYNGDYSSLNTAITTAEASIGFETGEYAPYNNVTSMKKLATAKALYASKDAINQDAIDEVTTALTSATWSDANAAEVNAVYDGTFKAAENNGAPAGWTMTDNTLGGGTHARAFVGNDKLAEFNNTKSAFYIRFDGYDSSKGSLYYYGKTDGYTMPLKENTWYHFTADFASWGSTYGPLRINVSGPSDYATSSETSTTSNDADASNDYTPQKFDFFFKTNVAGNYSFNIQNVGASTAHKAVITNIELFKCPAASATMTVKANKWGTFIAPFDVTIPTGVNAYTVTGVSENTIVKSDALETTIPANTPVILENTTESLISQEFNGQNISTADSYTVGLLTGVYTAETIAASDGDNTRYVLQTPTSGENEGKQAFYKVTSDFTATANRCYLTVAGGSVKAFFFDGDETAVSSVKADELQGATIYNLAGQRVSKAQKGVYIINGKKVAVK